jgi:hypothetical protein
MIQSETIIYSFSKSSDINKWYITNDDVMGGISTSKISLDENGNGKFHGKVSTENNGGFAMVRLPIHIEINNNSKKIVLKIKGDNKKYQFRLKSQKNQRYWYVQSFRTSNDWETIELPLTNFYPSFRGNKLDIENFNSNSIHEIAVLIGNKKNESFQLLIKSIEVL